MRHERPMIRATPFASIALLVLAGCGAPTPPTAPTSTTPASSTTPVASASTSASVVTTPAKPSPELLAADAPRETVAGTTFTAPAGWTLLADGPSVRLTAPEGNLRVVFVESAARDADAVVAAAWSGETPGFKRALKVMTPSPGREGWSERRIYDYETSPDEKREVFARALRRADGWTVVLIDGDRATYEKHIAQLRRLRDTTHPKGYAKESFAGRKANTLDAARVKQIGEFV
jgi:hypothetical protein